MIPENLTYQQFNTVSDTLRPQQIDALDTIKKWYNTQDNPKKYMIISAPTGAGKSLIAYITSKLVQRGGGSTFLLAPFNALLEQYERTFSPQQLALIKGQDNYDCIIRPCKYTEAPCRSNKKFSMRCAGECPYKCAKERAKNHPICLTNLHFLLLDFDFTGSFGTRDLAVIDECHCAEKVIQGYRAIVVDQKFLTYFNKVVSYAKNQTKGFENYSGFIPQELVIDNEVRKEKELFRWIDSLFSNLCKFKKDIDEYSENIQEYMKQTEKDQFVIDQYFKNCCLGEFSYEIEHVICKIANYRKHKEKTDWATNYYLDEKEDVVGFEVIPISVEFMTEDILNQFARKLIFMSGTIDPRRFAKDLGIPFDQCEVLELPMSFPVENRKIFFCPVGYMNYANKEKTLPKMVSFMDDLIEKSYSTSKGIVHTTSYANARFVFEHSRNAKRMLIHTSETKEEVLEAFYKSKNGILLSPSCTEGISLDDDLSRFQMFVKVPYLSLGDNAIKARMERDSEWYAGKTIEQIVQGSGRSVRSVSDYADTWILDGSFESLWKRNKNLFPKYFQEALVWV